MGVTAVAGVLFAFTLAHANTLNHKHSATSNEAPQQNGKGGNHLMSGNKTPLNRGTVAMKYIFLSLSHEILYPF